MLAEIYSCRTAGTMLWRRVRFGFMSRFMSTLVPVIIGKRATYLLFRSGV